jgi:hypothetical protein
MRLQTNLKKQPQMTKSIVLYNGPSMLDGAFIVAIATIGSSNEKTGPIIQTWIMRADMDPMEASRQAADSSVCGSCSRRWSTGGDCYVTLFQAPLSVWRAWDREGRPGANVDQDKLVALTIAGQNHGFRMGSYGDPLAVPHTVWKDILAMVQPKVHTGYTHQWRNVSSLHARGQWFRANVMASCDSIEDATEARNGGWRYFLAVSPELVPSVPERTILCLAERETNPRTCETCGICNGTQDKGSTAVSVFLVEHGARSQGKHKRSAKARTSAGLAVLA